ncbi:MAG: class I SAM-dependent methyltransferase [Fimbriimonas sp.]|nr:class I SAM-dependent methyltransferase [Fimbriimonas sp.]
MSTYWDQAPGYWGHIGPPLRPSASDIGFITDFVSQWRRRDLRVLILGVTQEYQRIEWPEATVLCAADREKAMIQKLWLGDPDRAYEADWRSLPVDPNTQDIVLCDGGLTVVDYPDSVDQIAQELYRVLSPGGYAIFRVFLPSPATMTPASVVDDLKCGRIGDLNILKIRLWQALQANPHQGVRLADVWDEVRSGVDDFDDLATRIGWQVERFDALELYRNCEDIYRLLTVDEVVSVFCKAGRFELQGVKVPSYPLGESCPSIAFRSEKPS